MVICINSFRTGDKATRLDGLLLMPFLGRINGYAINRRQWDVTDYRGEDAANERESGRDDAAP